MAFKKLYRRRFWRLFEMSGIAARIDPDWHKWALEASSRGLVTISDACKQAITIDRQSHQISTKTFYQALRYHGISRDTKPGPKASTSIEQIEPLIITLRNSGVIIGVTKMFYTINARNDCPNCTRSAVQQVYEKYGWIQKKKKKVQVPRCRYQALMCNAIWHVDIHFPEKLQGCMVYGIIDDRSRFLIRLSIITSKDAATCAVEMEKAIQEYGPVGAIWSDNGGENVGKPFLDMLAKYGTKTITTEPYNPQQNGKIERFWQSFEKMTTGDMNSIPMFVYNYNMVIIHTALGTNSTPASFYYNNPHWQKGMKIQWCVDGKMIHELK